MGDSACLSSELPKTWRAAPLCTPVCRYTERCGRRPSRHAHCKQSTYLLSDVGSCLVTYAGARQAHAVRAEALRRLDEGRGYAKDVWVHKAVLSGTKPAFNHLAVAC